MIANTAVGIGPATTLSSSAVAKVVERPDRVTLAGRAAFGTESKSARGALVAATANHVRFALALATYTKITIRVQ